MPRACPVRLADSVSGEPSRRACPEHPEPVEGRRGGKRTGAGAPRHNLNALKGGRYSPTARAYLLTLLRYSPLAALRFALRLKK